MPFTPITNTIRLVFFFSNGARNVMHVVPKTGASPFGLTVVTDAANEAEVAYTDSILTQQSAAVTLDEISATDISVANGATFTTTVGVAGSVAGTRLPDNVALVASWATAISGRSFRGRSFITGIPSSAADADGKQVTQAFRDGMDTEAASFKSSMGAGDFDLAVASPTLGTSSLVTSSNVDRRIDTQRRRLNNLNV